MTSAAATRTFSSLSQNQGKSEYTRATSIPTIPYIIPPFSRNLSATTTADDDNTKQVRFHRSDAWVGSLEAEKRGDYENDA